MTPRQFGPYELEELLGVGGMGEVWRARDTRRERLVALKLLPESLAQDQEFLSRFRRESHVAARLRELQDEIRGGKGTFVTDPKLTRALTSLSGFVEDMTELGRHATARLLDKRPVPATEDVARQLDVARGALVYRIERVRLADGVAMSFDETYLPLDIGEKVASNDLEAEPIFDLLELRYDLPLIEAQYQLEAVTADERVARALGVEPGSPIFLIERTSYSEGQRPVDYEKLYYRGDLIRFTTRLSRLPRKRD